MFELIVHKDSVPLVCFHGFCSHESVDVIREDVASAIDG